MAEMEVTHPPTSHPSTGPLHAILGERASRAHHSAGDQSGEGLAGHSDEETSKDNLPRTLAGQGSHFGPLQGGASWEALQAHIPPELPGDWTPGDNCFLAQLPFHSGTS